MAFSIVMIGATGAVGTQVVKTLQKHDEIQKISLFGRRIVDAFETPNTEQHVVDVFDPKTFETRIVGHTHAICTFGVGEPSKVSKEDFKRIDHDVVLSFAEKCKENGVTHFQLLSSVGVDPNSRSYFLRVKGELETALKELNFDHLSLFHPSMILTPTNRYGLSQAIILSVWPWISKLLVGPLRKFRGVPVETLGAAFANNVFAKKPRFQIVEYDDFVALAGSSFEEASRE